MSRRDRGMILLVEEESFATQDKKKSLEGYGYRVVTAFSGEEAILTCARSDDIGLILMNVDFGKEMSGARAAERILESRQMPIVFLTSNTDPNIIAGLGKISPYGIVQKDSSISILEAAMRVAFSLFEAKSVSQAQDLLQTLMDTTPDHIYFKDRDCRFIRVSKSHCELCGYDDPSRMIGKTDFDLFSKEHAEQAYADEQTIMRTGRMIKKEERETWSDRSDTWAYSIKMPLTDKAGNIIGTFGISRDITDLKRIEEKLAWEQSLLQALLDTSSDHIYFKDREGRFIRNSNAHAKLLGLSDTSEMIGKTDFDFFTPEHAKMAYEDEREIMETGRTLKKEETNLTASGPGVWVSMEKMPLRDAKGGVIGTFGISRDITERKRMEDMLAHEQYLLQTLMDNSSDNIYFKDLDSQFTRISKAQARYVGLDNVSDMIGKSDFDFFTIEHASRSYKDEQTIIRTGQAIRIEEENEKIGGVASWFLTEKMPLKSREGRIIGTFGISRNITERKQDEERIKNLLMEQMRAKSQTSETQDVTIYALAHLAELRDLETGKHLERTANYIRILAEELTRLGTFKGYLTPEYINGLFKSAPLHDIGKVGVPDAILLKPGRLSREELAVMQKHCELGARLLSSAEQKLKFQSFLNIAVQLTIGHHEKWNGTGYPSGLSCEQIPLSARLMGLADVYDALRSKRPYKEPFEHGDCVRIIKDERGRHFDPRIVDAFLNRELEFRKVSDEMAD